MPPGQTSKAACPSCGYDLTGAPTREESIRCPECGTSCSQAEAALRPIIPTSLVLLFMCVPETVLLGAGWAIWLGDPMMAVTAVFGLLFMPCALAVLLALAWPPYIGHPAISPWWSRGRPRRHRRAVVITAMVANTSATVGLGWPLMARIVGCCASV